MSSSYRIICFSHDPALIVEGRSWGDHTPAVEAIAEGLDEHPHCRLLVGRWSGGLIEVGCPRMTTSSRPGHAGYHPHTTQWADAGWLRLMALSTPKTVELARVPGCWQWDTARRLADHLGVAG